jgi:hypothetical protein
MEKNNNNTNKNSKANLRGRDSRTGEFTTVEHSRTCPNTHVVERMPMPGHADIEPVDSNGKPGTPINKKR